MTTVQSCTSNEGGAKGARGWEIGAKFGVQEMKGAPTAINLAGRRGGEEEEGGRRGRRRRKGGFKRLPLAFAHPLTKSYHSVKVAGSAR